MKTQKSPDFYLSSSESEEFSGVWKCWRKCRLRNSVRDDLLAIRVEPQIVETYTDKVARSHNEIIVASRHLGVSLFPIIEWPVHVYLCFPKESLLLDGSRPVADGEFVNGAWSALFQTEYDATLKDFSRKAARDPQGARDPEGA